MFEALVITLREGIEAALVVGIILAYLRKSGRQALSWSVHLGLAAGIAASALCAVVFARLGVEEEAYEGWLMLAGAAFVTTMVVWMRRTSKRLKGEIESRVEAIASRGAGAVGAGLFLFTFVMVLREGIETVLFLAAVNLTSDALLAFIGGLAGLAIALVFGVAFVRGTVRVDLPRFFNVTSIVLVILAAQLLVGGLHELGERGTIPIGREQMRLIGPIVKNDVLFIVTLLALPMIILLVPGRAAAARAREAETLDGPERRLVLARMRRETLWRRLLATAGIVAIASLTVSYAFTRLPSTIDPPKVLGAGPDGVVRLATTGLDDGHLHRFGVSIDGTIVRFFAMKSGEKVVPAFDACQVCGASGYIETRGRLVCLACAADVNAATLGTGGGCNPIPLTFARDGSDLVIQAADLAAQVDVFRASEGAATEAPTR